MRDRGKVTVLTVYGKKHKKQRSHPQSSKRRDWMAEEREREKVRRLVERVRSHLFP